MGGHWKPWLAAMIASGIIVGCTTSDTGAVTEPGAGSTETCEPVTPPAPPPSVLVLRLARPLQNLRSGSAGLDTYRFGRTAASSAWRT